MTQRASLIPPSIVVWNVVFMRAPRDNWWDWLTDPEWRHVCAFGYSATTKTWLVYDVADRYSRLVVLDDNWFDRWVTVNRKHITCIVKFHTQEGGDVRARLGFWCVTAIKHLLGLRSGALRPKALHRDLLANGGTLAFEEFYGRQGKSTDGRPRDESASGTSGSAG